MASAGASIISPSGCDANNRTSPCLQELEGAAGEISSRGTARAGLSRDLARTACLEWRCHPEQGRSAHRESTRLAGRSVRHSQPIHRCGGERRHHRLSLRTQRQSSAGAEVRLQARLAQAPEAARLDVPEAAAPAGARGDFNIVPTDFDIYNSRSLKKDALLQPRSRTAFFELIEQGWTDTLRSHHPEERIYTFWDYFRQQWRGTRDYGSITCSRTPRRRGA